MVDIKFRSDISVDLYGQWGGDLNIAEAAWVSTETEELLKAGFKKHDRSSDAVRGLINYLMKHRHGTPFEESFLSVTVEAPIFVAREWMRHRVQSFSEQSGRYTVLPCTFWIPRDDRGLINLGTDARPELGLPDRAEEAEHLWDVLGEELGKAYLQAAASYYELLENRVAKEVARACLPVATYTRWRARMNARSLMHFLSLRVGDENSRYRSYPQAEIEEGARKLEDIMISYWPETHLAFVQNGRVSP